MATPRHLEIAMWNEAVNAYNGESDRGAAILSGSFVEHALGLYLRSKIQDIKLADDLFSPLGPLSSFSQRIAIAYAFGFVSKLHHKDLELIRRIRNYFAHHPLDAIFSSPEITQLALQLSSIEYCPETSYPDVRKRFRTTYLLACGLEAGSMLLGLEKEKNDTPSAKS
jgi:hypothetical protein